MLIETPYKAGDIVSLKIASGEEVIGKLHEESPVKITIENPLMVIANQQGLGLAPFMFTIGQDRKVPLNANSILCIVKSDDDTAKQYIQSTTGIAL